MAQTTSAINLCNAVIRLDDGAGNYVDISGSSNSVDFNLKNSLGEFATFGSRWIARKECKSDGDFKLKFIYSTDANEATDLILRWFMGSRGKRRLRIYYPDQSTGSDLWEADVLCGDISGMGQGSDEAKPLMPEITLMPANGIAHQTVGS